MGYAERAVSLCGKCFRLYKECESAGQDAAPLQRASPFVLARDRHTVPLNAETSKIAVEHFVDPTSGRTQAAFSFH